MHQRLLSALLLFAAPCLFAQKADPTPPFDPKTAAEFLASAPDFSEYAKTFAERADSLYSATKYDDAGAAYFASKFLGFLADYSPSASKEYVAYMLGCPRRTTGRKSRKSYSISGIPTARHSKNTRALRWQSR